jgi:hypothetical protein
MITLSDFTIKIDLPALTRIADSLEGIHKQINAMRVTQQEIETRLLEISHELEDLNESRSETNPTPKPKQEFYY